MKLDLKSMHEWIVAELGRERKIAESMFELIDKCEAARPHPDWVKLRALPYSKLSSLRAWIKKPFREEAPVKPLHGLWFGLFNPCPDGRTPVADIYVSGSERFEPNANDNSWAVGPDWWPKSRYASSSILADIYRIAYRQGLSAGKREVCLGDDAEYPLCLAYGVFAVRELLAKADRDLILGKSSSLGIAVGFDRGDFILLGKLTSNGLSPIDPEPDNTAARFAATLKDLRSADGKKTFYAIFALQRFKEQAGEAIPDLLQILMTDDVGARQAVLNTLGQIAPDDPLAKAAVLNSLKDVSPFVRREALGALIPFNNLTATDLARIKDLENDSDEAVASWSEIALRNIGLRAKAGG